MEAPFPAVPIVIDEVTPAWLTQALRSGPAQLSGCTVEAVSHERVGADRGMDSVTYRLALTGKGVPETIVAKLAPPDAETRQRRSMMGVYEREARFYSELQPAVPLRTPRCYFAAFDPATLALALLLEDLSDGRFPDDATGSPEDVAALLREAAQMHARFADSTALPPWLQTDEQLFPYWAERLTGASARYEERMGGIGVLQASIIERFPGGLASGRLNISGPRTLCHGDFSLKNSCFFERPILFDWALVARRAGIRDVTTAILRSLAPQDIHDQFEALLDVYLEALHEAGGTGDAASLRTAFFQSVMAQLCPATLIVVSPPNPSALQFETSRRTWLQAEALFEFFDPLKVLGD